MYKYTIYSNISGLEMFQIECSGYYYVDDNVVFYTVGEYAVKNPKAVISKINQSFIIGDRA